MRKKYLDTFNILSMYFAEPVEFLTDIFVN